MDIGTNAEIIDDIDDEIVENNDQNESDSQESSKTDSNESHESNYQNSSEDGTSEGEDEDFVSSLLKSRGIEDKSKIKFETDEGDVEEVDWKNLSNQDKINILQSSEVTPETGLDESEIQLINTIRNSGMNPQEYLQYIGNGEVNRYIQNNYQPQFEIDQYSDDELFLMDFMSRTGEVTEDEAVEALQRAKANETLYQKQIESIRNEYKKIEQENLMQEQLEQEQLEQQQYEQFSNQIVDEINNLNEIQGFDLNMDSDDMQTLYDFITGSDAAGNNYLVKALSDPQILVKTAWLALNGDQMINDISNYFQKEIANVRKESYKKGVADTQNKINKSNNVVFKDKPRSRQEIYSDLDDF